MRAIKTAKYLSGAALFSLFGVSQTKQKKSDCCGIIGFVGKEKIAEEVVSQGITLLQNRGYDSAGITTLHKNELITSKLTSNFSKSIDCIKEIQTLAKKLHNGSSLGIGHTRWATCGERTDTNAHPHLDSKNRIALVHNGTIFNYKSIKENLLAKGYTFRSETDTEVIAVLIGSFLDEGLPVIKAIEKAVEPLEGTWGIVVISKDHPSSIFCCRKGSPLIIGVGENSLYVASEAIAFQAYTNKTVRMRENECLEVALDEKFSAIVNERIVVSEKVEVKVQPSPGFDCFYIEEINEQPEAVKRALSYYHRLLPETLSARLGGFDANKELALSFSSLLFVASGTSFNAALYAVDLFRKLRIFDSVGAVVASEFSEDDLPKGKVGAIFLTQSGETADVMKATKLAKSLGVVCIGVQNVVGSMITTICDFGLFLNCGREISVAATKSFTSMIVVLSLISLWYSANKNPNGQKAEREVLIQSLFQLPASIQLTIDSVKDKCKIVSERLSKLNSLILLGKGMNFAIAKEGALKIKEITYIHAEALNAGEIKHGPLAMVENNFDNEKVFQTHIVAIALNDKHIEEIKLSISEVKSRQAYTIVISDCPELLDLTKVDFLIEIPKLKVMSSILTVIPLQLFAYEIGRIKKVDIDRPRNLAKAVTVL